MESRLDESTRIKMFARLKERIQLFDAAPFCKNPETRGQIQLLRELSQHFCNMAVLADSFYDQYGLQDSFVKFIDEAHNYLNWAASLIGLIFED